MKMKVLYDGWDKPINLDLWLENNEKLLNNKRIFYVLRANSDRDRVTKIGISVDGDAKNRMKRYIIQHGKYNALNPCAGVSLFYIGYTEYNKNVSQRNSAIFRIEKEIKKEWRTGNNLIGRGSERTELDMKFIKKRIEQHNHIEDIVTEPRRSERNKRAEPRRSERNKKS